MSEQAKAAEAKADVAQSEVAHETTEAEAMEAALAAVEGTQASDDAKPEVKAKGGDEPAKKDTDAETEKEPEGPAAKGWAVVKKREQRLAKEAKSLRESQQLLQAQFADFQARAKALEEREAALEQDPVSYLKKKGLNFDDLAGRFLHDGKPTEQELARRNTEQAGNEVKTLKTELQQVKELLRTQEEGRLVSQYRDTIRSTLASDEFGLLRTYPNAEDEVFEFADKWARQTGQILQPADAASKLQAEWRKQLSSLGTHQAVRELLLGANGAAQKQVAGGPSQVPQRQGASPRTLTNNLAATPAANEPDFDALSEDEQIQAALRLVQDA